MSQQGGATVAEPAPADEPIQVAVKVDPTCPNPTLGCGPGGGGGFSGGIGGSGSASSPVGRSGNPLQVNPGTNAPANIYGRDYSGHAIDRMQGRGIPPSAVENTIQTGVRSPGNVAGSTAHYDRVNNMTVITDTASGRVVTIRQGPP
jgi:hypothetical protein